MADSEQSITSPSKGLNSCTAALVSCLDHCESFTIKRNESRALTENMADPPALVQAVILAAILICGD